MHFVLFILYFLDCIVHLYLLFFWSNLKSKDGEIIILKKQQVILALFQKDCSLRKTTKLLYVCKSSV